MTSESAALQLTSDSGKHPRRSTLSGIPVLTMLKSWINRWIAVRRRRESLEYLATLDDHILDDIGLSRVAIYKELNQPFSSSSGS